VPCEVSLRADDVCQKEAAGEVKQELFQFVHSTVLFVYRKWEDCMHGFQQPEDDQASDESSRHSCFDQSTFMQYQQKLKLRN
jgi:hypothetical protein